MQQIEINSGKLITCYPQAFQFVNLPLYFNIWKSFDI